MSPTNSLVDIAIALKQKLVDHKDDVGIELADVFYGDQNKIATTPIACVEPDNKATMLRNQALARVTDLVLIAQIIVYSSLVDTTEVNRIASDRLAENIETLIHLDPQLGGLVTHGYCTGIQSGYATKTTGLVRATRITYEGRTAQFVLPSS